MVSLCKHDVRVQQQGLKERLAMPSTAINTVVKMLESLPETAQDRVERLREYIQDLQDDIQWDVSFRNTEQGLVAAAQRARREIAEGKAAPFRRCAHDPH